MSGELLIGKNIFPLHPLPEHCMQNTEQFRAIIVFLCVCVCVCACCATRKLHSQKNDGQAKTVGLVYKYQGDTILENG